MGKGLSVGVVRMTNINSSTKTLSKAKIHINDEFYTKYETVEDEVRRWMSQNVFKDKIILMPCDTPESKFVEFFLDNYNKLDYKKLVITHYDINVKSLFSKYNTGKYWIYEKDNLIDHGCLDGSGDFRSLEIQKIFKTSDMVVTNPPFSLIKELQKQCIDYGLDYLLICSMWNISNTLLSNLKKSDMFSINPIKFSKFDIGGGGGDGNYFLFYFKSISHTK